MLSRTRGLLHLCGALLLTLPALQAAAPKGTAPRDMKLLIIAVDGNEPDYAAIKFFVETLGIPYQTAFTLDTTKTPPAPIRLPPLNNGSKGFFQGILLTNGNTGYCKSGSCYVGLDAAQWTLLENYARDYEVRIASYYTFPEARYGLAPSPGAAALTATQSAPVTARFTGPASALFPGLKASAGLSIVNSYVYPAQPVAGNGETTTPFLLAGSAVLGALHTKADGREYMALTMDNNPNLHHSLLLNYGILNWVMKGVFIGGRKVYLTPQVDDYFLPNDLFVLGQAACMGASFATDPTANAAINCPTRRIDGPDVKTLAEWQSKWQQKPQFQRFRVTHAFNGYGAAQDGRTLRDDLIQQTLAFRSKFYWVSHTWDHQNLDCFRPVPNSGPAGCRPATEQESAEEIAQNAAQAKELGLPLDTLSMVTPAISGLNNTAFLSAAAKAGIRYLVSDTSKQGLPAMPNTGTYTANGILLIPRRPTNIFYNVITGETNAQGSLTDEYNHFFGPAGLFKDGSGKPFFEKTQSYKEILNRESDNLVAYMLRAEIYPQMYHQSNLVLYDGRNSIFSDVHDAALNKFAAISDLPVISLSQADLGREIEAKMAVVGAKVSGVLTPGKGVTLTASRAANVPVTGLCFGSSCESYGSQCTSRIAVQAGSPTNVNFSSGTTTCAVNPGLPDIPAPPVPAVPPSAPNRQMQNLAAAQQSVAALAQQPGVRDADREKLVVLSRSLTGALETALWINGDSLQTDGGIKVFDALKASAQQLMTMGQDARSQPDAATARSLLTAIAEISRTIAQLAIANARTMSPSNANVLTAQNHFSAANTALNANSFPSAIDGFGKAWQSAQKAINSSN